MTDATTKQGSAHIELTDKPDKSSIEEQQDDCKYPDLKQQKQEQMDPSESNEPVQFDSESPSLDTLPPEVFLTICSYLPASFILTKLTLVCKAFRDLLMDDATWKIRIAKRCQKLYPRVPESSFDWKLACMEREDAESRWRNPETSLDAYQFTENVNSAVDVVHLMDHGNLLASGSRDRDLVFWDLKRLDPDNPDTENQTKLLTKANAHSGWIWAIASRQHFIATGAWDASVKIWDVGPSCEEIRKVRCNSAILCAEFVDNMVIAGAYDQHTYYIDSRTGSITCKLRQHRRSVLCLTADVDYVITGSEDRTVCVYDRTAGKKIKTITLDHFPMSVCRVGNQVLVGDKVGNVHLIDANHGNFDLVKTYDVGHSGRVTGIVHSPGCTVTSSVDRTIRVLEPCDLPATLHTISTHSQEVAGLSYCEGTLASAGSDCKIGIWRPKRGVLV